MSALEPTTGEVFSVRIIKTLNANPSVRWANTYEIRGVAPSISPSDLVNASDMLVTFERNLLFNTATLLYSTVSTLVPDSKPYNGDEFLRLNYNQLGILTSPLTDVEPLTTCLRISFAAITGRVGFRLYRHALNEGDVNAPSGSPGFADVSIITARLTAAITASNITDYVLEGGAPMELVLASSSGVRPVGSIGLQGITVKKLNNKYFDRSPAP